MQNSDKTDKLYLFSTLLLMLILPVLSVLIEYMAGQHIYNIWNLIGKWFVFWAVGLRLFSAGISQVIRPAFTAGKILNIKNDESHMIVRELGFANISIGIAGIISLFVPGWRIAVAFTGGLFIGIAGVQHIIRRPAGLKEIIAMISNIFVFFILVLYLYFLLLFKN